ncbi:VWA domain-containing protein [Georgenia sp. TF02-10]|uniref:vWA domain-containing protein n=1 Tax=Georgenia sp. TF02-10 TaxID=2917725 RepID=UPI001FA78AE8|nr:VWA domain-containing protein [Georgenia sp. TF02-10]UNX54691.1 VWA domain-containing protein [Georgenia sp. TF02-10]
MILRLVWPLWALAVVLGPLLLLCGWAWWQARRGGDDGGPWLRRAAMVLATLVIGLAPAVPAETVRVATDAEVFFVVDRTGSMAAEDHDGGRPRLAGVREDLVGLLEALPGARYSVIAFDSQASRQLPLTSDARAVRSWAETLRQEITGYSAGSSVERPLTALTTALTGAAERNPAHVRIVFFLSDGENTAGAGGGAGSGAGSGADSVRADADVVGTDTDGVRAAFRPNGRTDPNVDLADGGGTGADAAAAAGARQASADSGPPVGGYAALAPLVDAGAVLGYGTADGGRMRSYDGTDATGPGTSAPYITDQTQPGNPPAVSRLDETALRRLAADLGVDYAHRTGRTGVEGLVAGIDVEQIAADGRRVTTTYRDVYWPAAVVLAALVAWEAYHQARSWRRLREQVPRAEVPA